MSTSVGAALAEASKGFDLLFADDVTGAIDLMQQGDSPFHAVGAGVATFLQAALGLEKEFIPEASRRLTMAEQGAKEAIKVAKGRSPNSSHRFPAALEWEILQADAVVMNGLTHALNENYMGYVQALYALNNAHSKFTKLFQSTFPNGLEPYENADGLLINTTVNSAPSQGSGTPTSPQSTRGTLFSKWSSAFSSPRSSKPPSRDPSPEREEPVNDFIIAGAAFGFGLFTMVFSLLPTKVKGVIGWFGFKTDRKLALRALAVACSKRDVHSVFASLTLMTYYGIVLLLSGWQAEETKMIEQYQMILNPMESKYADGALWVLQKAKIHRYSGDLDAAVEILQCRVAIERPSHFKQADALLIFELAWALLARRNYSQSAEKFIQLTTMNNWSPAAYHYIAAVCYVDACDYSKAQQLMDKVPELLERKKLGGREIPIEIFIRKKMSFVQEKHRRLHGEDPNFVRSIKISAAEEISIFWNLHARLPESCIKSRINDWLALSPASTIPSPFGDGQQAAWRNNSPPDLDTEDELGLRDLLLGVLHRSACCFPAARNYLLRSVERQNAVAGKWMSAVARFELAVLELKQCEANPTNGEESWISSLDTASEWLEQALAMLNNNVDLQSRLDTRITMLKDEIASKKHLILCGDSSNLPSFIISSQ